MKRTSFDVIPTDRGIEINILHPKDRSRTDMGSFAGLFVRNLRSIIG